MAQVGLGCPQGSVACVVLPILIRLHIPLACLALFLTGCAAGKFDYIRPVTSPPVAGNSKIIDKSRDLVWENAVAALGKQYFVINNMDRGSGFINMSYSGDPERYVDCGRIVSYVSNLRGPRTYDFAGAKADQTYEVMNGLSLYSIHRTMSLEGRMNLVFEAIAQDKTRVTVTTRYVISRDAATSDVMGHTQQLHHSISTNSGASASFPVNSSGLAVECVPTGKLESEVLDLIQ